VLCGVLCLCRTSAHMWETQRSVLLLLRPADGLLCVFHPCCLPPLSPPCPPPPPPPPHTHTHLHSYEGEFQVGYAHGLGQMTSVETGEVFLGEFFAGQRHG
jgi:hypothetical protein